MAERYRYVDEHWQDSGTALRCFAYPVVKGTEKGAWILVHGERRFVLDGGGKRFAHATQREALMSFFQRKKRQIAIYDMRAERAREAKALAEYLLDNGRELKAGESFSDNSIPWSDKPPFAPPPL